MRISDQEASRLQVLKAIRRAEPVARTELAQRTGLSTQAISDVTADLLARDLLLEARAAARGPGRPRTLLRLNPDAAREPRAYGARIGPRPFGMTLPNALCAAPPMSPHSRRRQDIRGRKS